MTKMSVWGPLQLWYILTLLISGLLTVNQFELHNNTVCERKAGHLVISSCNKYCFEQYLFWYSFSHPQEFFLLCIPKKKKNKSHKHWSRDDSSALAVPSFCVSFTVSWCSFHIYVQESAMNMSSVPNVCSGVDQTYISDWITESCVASYDGGETVLLMEGVWNRKLVHAPVLQWKAKLTAFQSVDMFHCCLVVWLLDL